MMASLTWILALLCAAGCHLSSSSPVLRSAQVVQTGQNVSLSCNLSTSLEVTWYLLRSDQLQPLLTVSKTKLEEEVVSFHKVDDQHLSWGGGLDQGLVRLEIMRVEEEDAGFYFCSGRCTEGKICFNRGIHLTVNGVDDGNKMSWQPCWSLGICVLPGLLAACFVGLVGFYLCSAKPGVCCCNPRRQDITQEEEALQYSSLKHQHKPRPSGRGGTGLDSVTYSTVANRMTPNESRDHR